MLFLRLLRRSRVGALRGAKARLADEIWHRNARCVSEKCERGKEVNPQTRMRRSRKRRLADAPHPVGPW